MLEGMGGTVAGVEPAPRGHFSAENPRPKILRAFTLSRSLGLAFETPEKTDTPRGWVAICILRRRGGDVKFPTHIEKSTFRALFSI
jgi:hypothetical protein